MSDLHATVRPMRPLVLEETRRYERRLPHLQRPGRYYHVTFATGEGFVLSPPARDVVIAAISFHDGSSWEVGAAAVMPTHVHLLVLPLPMRRYPSDTAYHLNERILQSVKSFSAHRINALLRRSGAVWEAESIDREIVSQAGFDDVARCIADKPVEEGLAETPRGYPWLRVHRDIAWAWDSGG